MRPGSSVGLHGSISWFRGATLAPYKRPPRLESLKRFLASPALRITLYGVLAGATIALICIVVYRNIVRPIMLRRQHTKVE